MLSFPHCRMSSKFPMSSMFSTRFLLGFLLAHGFSPSPTGRSGLFRAKHYLRPRKLGIIILLPPRPSVFTAELHYQYSVLHCSILHCTTISILSGRCVCKKSDRPWLGGWVGEQSSSERSAQVRGHASTQTPSDITWPHPTHQGHPGTYV